MDQPDTLQQAIDVARSGNRMGASRLLAQYVTQDPQNDVAWLWLAACLDEPEQQQYCLKKASAINPNNPDTISSLNELLNPPWAWKEPEGSIELPAGNGSAPSEVEAVAAPPPAEQEPEPAVFVFPEPELPPAEPILAEAPADQPEGPVVVAEAAVPPKKAGLSGFQIAVLVVLVIAILAVLIYLGYMILTASPDTLPPFLRNLLYGSGVILIPGL